MSEIKIEQNDYGWFVKQKINLGGAETPNYAEYYLSYHKRGWVIHLDDGCYFPTRDLAESFYKLRMTSQNRWGELHTIALHSVMDKTALGQGIFANCKEFSEIYKDIESKLKGVLNA